MTVTCEALVCVDGQDGSAGAGRNYDGERVSLCTRDDVDMHVHKKRVTHMRTFLQVYAEKGSSANIVMKGRMNSRLKC